jgi:hypothetical protein
MDHKGLRVLLVVHGCITLAAGLVLTIAPSLIPSIAGIYLAPSAYVLAYLLAGAEFEFSVLSFGSSRLTDARADAVAMTDFNNAVERMVAVWKSATGCSIPRNAKSSPITKWATS